MTGASNCCNYSKYLTSAALVFVWILALGWLVHGKLLMAQYAATASLWRTPEEMQALLPYHLLRLATLSLVFSVIYHCWRSRITIGAVGSKDCPHRKSFGFGVLIGLFQGINAAAGYIYMPIPATLALAWLADQVLLWVSAALILSLYSTRSTKADA